MLHLVWVNALTSLLLSDLVLINYSKHEFGWVCPFNV